MRNCILSALAGALCMFFLLLMAANMRTGQEQEVVEYEHMDYISGITQEACFVCGDKGCPYWGEDNVGIVDLNTFELLRLEISRYDGNGALIGEPAGYMTTGGLIYDEGSSSVYGLISPDDGYANLEISGVRYSVDRTSVQEQLCQKCLDAINGLWFGGLPPAEFAVVSFEERTIRPLLRGCTWFSAGNYGVDCAFRDNGKIDLLIHYCAPPAVRRQA